MDEVPGSSPGSLTFVNKPIASTYAIPFRSESAVPTERILGNYPKSIGDCTMVPNDPTIQPLSSRIRVPNYRKHKASGQARVTLSGKDFYLGKFRSPESLIEYNRLISEWTAAGCRVVSSPGSSLTVVELLDQYVSDLATKHPSKSQLEKAKQACRLLRDQCGAQPVSNVTPFTLRAIQSLLAKRGNCTTTIAIRVSCIVALLGWGKREGLVPVEVFERLKDEPRAPRHLGAPRPKSRQPLTPDELEQALRVLPPMIADMVTLQRHTGMRPGEICNMTWSQIQRASSGIWIYDPEQHKNAYLGKERVIPLGPQCQAILMKYQHRRPDEVIFSPRESERLRLDVLHSQRKTPMTPSQRQRANDAEQRADSRNRGPGLSWRTDSYRRAIQTALEKHGLKKWFPYLLRHTRATEIRQMHGLDTAQAALGHAHIRTTEMYAKGPSDWMSKVAV